MFAHNSSQQATSTQGKDVWKSNIEKNNYKEFNKQTIKMKNKINKTIKLILYTKQMCWSSRNVKKYENEGSKLSFLVCTKYS